MPPSPPPPRSPEQVPERIPGHAPEGDGTRVVTLALVAACTGMLGALWVANHALANAAAYLPAGDASTAARLRAASWLLGAAALGSAALAVVHGAGVRRRAAARAAELERLSAELMRANRAKSEFLANVSHELRTPLNAVVGFAELMQDGVYGTLAPQQVGPVQRIAASATHLRHLVDQILDLAKIAAGRLEVHTESVALRPFVLEVAGAVDSLVQEKGLALSIAVPASLPRLRSDPLHVRQILLNLLGNAVKFTPTGGRIAVRALLAETAPGSTPFAAHGAAAAHDGDPTTRRFQLPGRRGTADPAPDGRTPAAAGVPWIAVQVADTGPGIGPADQARIFDEFEQLGSRTGDGAERGTGLGLAISRRLALLLGGELTLESARGEGSTFTLWLPVDPVDVPADDGAPGASRDGAARPPAAGERRQSERRSEGRRRSDRTAG